MEKNRKEVVGVGEEDVYMGNEMKGVSVSGDEIEKVKKGEEILVDGMKWNEGKELNGNVE